MKRSLPFVIVAMVALLTLGAGAMLYRSKRAPVLRISKDQAAENQSAGSVHVRGNPKASVTLEEYGDFECPPCGKLAGPLLEIEHEFGDRLRVIFHHFPLTTHAHARDAAFAAEAAGRQNRFWEMHDLLYKEQAVWSALKDPRPLFSSYAGVLALDREQFAKDMESEQVKARVAADEERGKTLGIVNTPTILINNTAVPPNSLSPREIHNLIAQALGPQKEKP